MQITFPISEALTVATSQQPLPPMVASVLGKGNAVFAEIDLRLVPDPPMALRLAAAAVGTVSVVAVFTGYTGGVATFEIGAQARSLPAHKLVNHLTAPINTALRSRGLPDGLVEVRRGTDEPVLALRLQDAIASKVAGVTLVALDIRDGAIHATLSLGAVRPL